MIEYACRAFRNIVAAGVSVYAGLSAYSLELAKLEKMRKTLHSEDNPMLIALKLNELKRAEAELPHPFDFISDAYKAAHQLADEL